MKNKINEAGKEFSKTINETEVRRLRSEFRAFCKNDQNLADPLFEWFLENMCNNRASLPIDEEIEYFIDDEIQKDWADLAYKKVYENGLRKAFEKSSNPPKQKGEKELAVRFLKWKLYKKGLIFQFEKDAWCFAGKNYTHEELFDLFIKDAQPNEKI